ncbi:MAG: hypothetical protein LBT59_29975 [Clostridiales bacterium]|jgi:hypothetical protein|nr:hypothetical protein [Clostridiales bacterium]
MTLERIIGSGQKVSPAAALDWGLRTIDAIVARKGRNSSRAVEIDAGMATLGKYDPPEEFARSLDSAKHGSFGETWPREPRAEAYRLGMAILDLIREEALKPDMSRLRKVLSKCVHPDPAQRYGTLGALRKDLKAVRDSIVRPWRAIALRSTAAIAMCAVLAVSGGYSQWKKESASKIVGGTIIITKNSDASPIVEKQFADGTGSWVGGLDWEVKSGESVSLSEGVIHGESAGKSLLEASYKGQAISLSVKVIEQQGAGETSIPVIQYFQADKKARVYAGDPSTLLGGSQDILSLPRSIAVDNEGSVYLADGRDLMKLTNGSQEVVSLGGKAPTVLKSANGYVYALVEWEDDQGILRDQVINVSTGTEIYTSNEIEKRIIDFSPSVDGLVFLLTVTDDGKFLETASERVPGYEGPNVALPKESEFLAADDKGAAYVSCPEIGVIYRLQAGVFELFAGLSRERGIIDGEDLRLYQPNKMKWNDGCLYVWDLNVLRKISVKNGKPDMATTVTGTAHSEPEAYESFRVDSQLPSDKLKVPFSRLGDFTFSGGKALVLDQKNRVIWEVDK